MRIIKYGADWCGPCRATTKTLKESGYDFIDIDIDDEANDELIASKNIRSIPVIEFYKDNEETPAHVHCGLLTKEELLTIINNLSC